MDLSIWILTKISGIFGIIEIYPFLHSFIAVGKIFLTVYIHPTCHSVMHKQFLIGAQIVLNSYNLIAFVHAQTKCPCSHLTPSSLKKFHNRQSIWLPFDCTLQMVFSGNNDAETVITHWFPAHRRITARFVRVVCLSCSPGLICCLRFELFGCDGGVFFSPFPENNASFIS